MDSKDTFKSFFKISTAANSKCLESRTISGNFPNFNEYKYISSFDCIDFVKNTAIDSEALLELFNELKSPNWIASFLTQKNENGYYEVGAVNKNTKSICSFSLMKDDINFLFLYNNECSYVLVQHCQNLCLIYPSELIVIKLSDVDPWIERAVKNFNNVLERIRGLDISILYRNGKLIGLNVSQARPYHFFYDYMYGLSFLSSYSSTNFDLYLERHHTFLGEECFQNYKNVKIRSDYDLNTICLSKNGFLVMPCIQYVRTRYDFAFEKLSSKLVSCANNQFNKNLNNPVFDSNLIVWISLNTEKRSWIEQVEGFANILNKLAEEFGSIGVLVDGLTFPICESESDRLIAKKELELFNKLKLLVPASIFVNMIGMRALEKIYYADKINFFISHYSTDSLYPSAICGKPGVVYSPVSMSSSKSMHVHKNIIEVNQSEIFEKSISEHDSWYDESLSIDWNCIYKCVNGLIKNIL